MTGFGPLSAHMLQHIVIMNLVVPGLVYLLRVRIPERFARSWPIATATQIALLYFWHAPPVLTQAMDLALTMGLMQASLALSSAWFWLAMASLPATARWRAVFALLVTGKLFCLLGALLVFAPQQLYGTMTHGAHTTAVGSGLMDQHLAGVMMLIACPLTYVAAAIVITARWFLALEGETQSASR